MSSKVRLLGDLWVRHTWNRELTFKMYDHGDCAFKMAHYFWLWLTAPDSGAKLFLLNDEKSVHYDQFLPLAKTQWRWIKGVLMNRPQLFVTKSDMSGLSLRSIQKNFHSSFKTEDRTSSHGLSMNRNGCDYCR